MRVCATLPRCYSALVAYYSLETKKGEFECHLGHPLWHSASGLQQVLYSYVLYGYYSAIDTVLYYQYSTACTVRTAPSKYLQYVQRTTHT